MPAVPITVRQLEAVVRISESLARMQLQVDVTENHVQQAMDLFRTSTMDAVRAGATEGLVCISANKCSRRQQYAVLLCPHAYVCSTSPHAYVCPTSPHAYVWPTSHLRY